MPESCGWNLRICIAGGVERPGSGPVLRSRMGRGEYQ